MPQRKEPMYCRYNTYDEERDVAQVCGERIPPGELTWIALNSRTGDRLALCDAHRQLVDDWVESLRSASVGAAIIVGTHTELPDKQLISEASLRQILRDREADVPKTGPLSPSMRRRAIAYEFGSEIADQVIDGQDA